MLEPEKDVEQHLFIVISEVQEDIVSSAREHGRTFYAE